MGAKEGVIMIKIILKPTDYVFYKDGRIDYSYSYNDQYSDGKYLNSLSAEELLKEEQKRWDIVQKSPLPSNVSKHSLARDLALAKGYIVSNANSTNNKSAEMPEREF